MRRSPRRRTSPASSPIIPRRQQGGVRAMAEPMLVLRGVSKSYGPLQVLRKVDLDVYAGEVVALLGANGAGKSTLSGIIAGSVMPFEGEMSWRGQLYAPASPREA